MERSRLKPVLVSPVTDVAQEWSRRGLRFIIRSQLSTLNYQYHDVWLHNKNRGRKDHIHRKIWFQSPLQADYKNYVL